MARNLSKPEPDPQPGQVNALAKAILDAVSAIPPTAEPPSDTPNERVRAIRTVAALKAAAVSGTLALPPGPYGIATLVPDLLAVWRIQAQMVVDIAAAYGKSAALGQEQMLYCLFRHSAAQAVRDLVMRVGGRVLVQQGSLRITQKVVQKIGIQVTQRSLSRGIARWLPVVGAAGVGAYAYYDTVKVGETALELFASEVIVSTPPPEPVS
jgi:hypothetical protein